MRRQLTTAYLLAILLARMGFTAEQPNIVLFFVDDLAKSIPGQSRNYWSGLWHGEGRWVSRDARAFSETKTIPYEQDLVRTRLYEIREQWRRIQTD